MSLPLISIVIPAFNRKEVVIKTLASIQNQNFRSYEILIIDDASFPPIKTFLESYEDKRIKYYRNKKNLGAAKSRNIGLAKASGQYTAFLDSDDEWDVDYLKNRINCIEKSDADLVYSGVNIYKDHVFIKKSKARNLSADEKAINYLLSGRLRAVTSTLFGKTKILKEFAFRPELTPHEDYQFFIEIAENRKVICCDEVNVKYNITSDSLSSKIDRSSILLIEKNFMEIKYHIMLFFLLRKSSFFYKKENSKELINEVKVLIKTHSGNSLLPIRIFSHVICAVFKPIVIVLNMCMSKLSSSQY